MTLVHMGAPLEIPPLHKLVRGFNARRTGRVRVTLIRCTLGNVLDLSSTGMRTCFRGTPPEEGSQIQVHIEGVVKPIEVWATVVWVRKTGWRRYELGLKFMDVSQEAHTELTAIARAGPQNPPYLQAEWRANLLGDETA
jgi:hypothetical protein